MDCSSAKHVEDSTQLEMCHTPYALEGRIKQVTTRKLQNYFILHFYP